MSRIRGTHVFPGRIAPHARQRRAILFGPSPSANLVGVEGDTMPGNRLKRLILGEPLSTFHAAHERIPKWKALSTLSSDALSSVAYATDAILYVLAGFSAYAVIWSIPIAF